jgi:uncharacterized protein (UPF0333 family)
MKEYLKKLFSNSGEASMVPFAVLLLLLLIAAMGVIYLMLIWRGDAVQNMAVISAHIAFMEWVFPVLLFAVGITGFYEYKSKTQSQ